MIEDIYNLKDFFALYQINGDNGKEKDILFEMIPEEIPAGVDF